MTSMGMSGEQVVPPTRVNPGYEREGALRNRSNANSSGGIPEEYEGNRREGQQPADARPVLPPFWGSAQESPHIGSGDASNDVWRELNSDSPSLLRLQCLWAYFNLPALSLADSVPGVASVAAQTDGFHSVVQVSSPLLHAPHVESVKDIYFARETLAIVFTGIQLAVDLRGAGEAFEKAVCLRDQQMIPSLLLVKNVPAVRIESDGRLGPYGYVTVRKHKAFRWIVSLAPSDARVYDVFEMADGFELGGSSGLFAIGAWIVDLRTFSALRMLFRSELRHSRTAQPEYLLEAAMEAFGGIFGQEEGDGVIDFGQGEVEVTGSTAIPVASEGTQERGTPSSLPEGEQLDDDEDNKSPQLASATLHMMGSPVDHHSCPHGERQQHLKESDYTISAVPSEMNESANAGSILEQEDDSCCPTENSQNLMENRDFDRQCSIDNLQEGISSNCTQSDSESPVGRVRDLPSSAISDESSSREDEQQPAEALQDDSATAERNSETSRMPSNATISSGEDELGVPLVDQFEDQHHHEAADMTNTISGESCPVETSNAVTNVYDSTIEKQLKLWIDTKGEAEPYEDTVNVFERHYPSHEFEYWAIDDILVAVEQNYESDEPGTLSVNCGDEVFLFSVTNTSWAFCRTKGGELGYVPTVAVPDAFRKMFKHTKMYARRTASVDRFCKWKGTVLHAGDPVVILAELGKWVLVRDYSRPFRQAFVQRGRIQQ